MVLSINLTYSKIFMRVTLVPTITQYFDSNYNLEFLKYSVQFYKIIYKSKLKRMKKKNGNSEERLYYDAIIEPSFYSNSTVREKKTPSTISSSFALSITGKNKNKKKQRKGKLTLDVKTSAWLPFSVYMHCN